MIPDYNIVILDENLLETERVSTVGLTETTGHDFRITEEGNYMLISYHSEVRDMTQFGFDADDFVADSIIQEITPDREIVWQ